MQTFLSITKRMQSIFHVLIKMLAIASPIRNSKSFNDVAHGKAMLENVINEGA